MGRAERKARGGEVVRLDVGCATVRACVPEKPEISGKGDKAREFADWELLFVWLVYVAGMLLVFMWLPKYLA